MTDFNDRFNARTIVDGPMACFPPGEAAAPGTGWVFVTGHGRTGSMALARMLSEHDDCSVSVEDGTPHLLYWALTTRLLQVEAENGPTIKAAHCEPTVDGLRSLCEAWRRHRHGRARVAGDKLWAYWGSRDKLRRLFPGCLIVYACRNPLDQLASFVALGAEWVRPTGDLERALEVDGYLRHQCDAIAQAHREAEQLGDVVVARFEDLAGSRSRLATLDVLWHRLGLPASHRALARVGGAGYDAPAGAVGRAGACRDIAGLLDDLRNLGRLPELRRALEAAEYPEVAAYLK